MVKANLWLDKTPAREKASVSQNSGTGSWVTGVVREVMDGGNLRVGVPADDPVSEAVVPSDGTVSAVGAVVRVLVDSRGRAVHGGAPVSVPDGADLVPSGAVGQWVQSGQDGLRTRLDQARTELEASMAALGVNLDEAVDNPEVVAPAVWAKIATFAKVTTEMLVAGDATIAGTAVVGDLVGNTLRGGVLSLLDQAQTPSTATGSNTASDWSYAPDGVMSGDTTGSVSTVSGYPVVTINSGTTPGGFFTASMQYGAVFGPADAVGAITYSVTVKVAGGSGPISFSVQSNEATTYHSGYVNAVSGGTYTLKATIPEGQWLSQKPGSVLNRVALHLGQGFSQGTTFTITSITASWPPALKTGLKIYRDSTGQARIDVVGDDGNTAILNSSGVTMKDASGATIGTTPWLNFIAPPIGMDRAQGTAVRVQAGTWTRHPLTSGATGRGGVSVSGGGFVIPLAGIYQVVVTVRMNVGNGSGYLAGAALMVNGVVNNDSLFGYVPMNTGSWTSATASGIVRLSAGDVVHVAGFHNLAGDTNMQGFNISVVYVA